jgi:poly-gamma-glutamate synthesis protein (capsule biosynthesis protein)
LPEKEEFNLVATGDSLIFQKISVFDEPDFLKVREIIKNSDVAFNNFETIIPTEKAIPRFKIDPTAWMRSPPYVLDELLWMGFNIFSLANNHSMDYSEQGLIDTKKIFETKGVCNSGTGKTLSEARAPAFLNTAKGRVALISVNTRGEDIPASDPKGEIPGRPGVNPMRGQLIVILNENMFFKMGEICESLGLPGSIDGKLRFLDIKIEKGVENDLFTKPYQPDLEGNVYSIKKARDIADYVLVSIHNHDKLRPGKAYFDDTIEYLSEYVEVFCREAIEAGADAVLGHGTHCLNGIEIYKGKPIFYGLGNFIAQNYQASPKPYDWYEARGFHKELYPDTSNVNLQPILDGDEKNRSELRLRTSIIANIRFINKTPKEAILYPIEMNRLDVQGGRPYLLHGEAANEVLSRLSRLSKRYGTRIEIKNDIGRIEF